MERKYFIDGLRGWACLMVFFSHLLKYFLIGVTPEYFSPWLKFVSDGRLAVYIFFVLSGFALAIGYFESKDLKGVAALTVRRYPRLILPIFIASTIAFGLMMAGLMYSQQAAILLKSKWVGGMYNFEPTIANLLSFGLFDVFFKYYDTKQYIPVLWTMPVEFYGSLLVFLSLLVLHFLSRRWVFYLSVGVILYLMNSMTLPFLFGMALAELYTLQKVRDFRHTKHALLIGSGLLLLGIYISTFQRQIYDIGPLGITLVALCITIPVMFCAPVAKLFETRLSRFMGRISFPLFLTHIIVMHSAIAYLVVYLHEQGVEWSLAVSNAIVLTSTTAVILVATAFEPVERLAIRLARQFSHWIMK